MTQSSRDQFTRRSVSWTVSWALAAVVAVVLVGTGPLRAADPQYVGVLALLEEREVATQLGLSETQRQDLIKVIDARELEALNFRDLEGEEKDDAITDLRVRAESEGLRILTDVQKGKLKEIRDERRTAAEAALADDAPAESDEPNAPATDADEPAKIAGDADDSRPESAPADFDESGFERVPADSKPTTEEPRSPDDEDLRNDEGSPDDESPPDDEGLPDDPSRSPDDARRSAQRNRDDNGDRDDPPRREFERGPPSRTPANGDSQSAPDTANAPAAASEPIPVEPIDPEGKIRFKVRYQPWDAVLEWFASAAGYNLLMENPPTGTFNYTSSKPYTPAEAIDLLNGVLLTKGMVLVRNHDLLMLVRTDEVPSILVQYVPLDELDARGEYELVRTIFSVERGTPDEIEAEIRPMLGTQGSIIKLSKAKQIQVVETAGRLRAIRKVIEGIENPPPSSDDKLHLLELAHIKADQLIPQIQDYFQMPDGETQTEDGSLRILYEPISGLLYASGKQEQRNRLTEFIKAFDRPNPNGGDEVLEAPQFVVYPIDVADSQAVLAVLQTLLAGQPGVKLSVDAKTGHVNALARPSQHATIKAIVDEMQSDGRQVEVIHLRYVDPELAALMIAKLYANETNPANAPIVDADPFNRRLVIRGSKAQIAQITDLLAKMGETATSDDPNLLASGKGNVRVIPLSGRQARTLLDEIEPFWNLQRTNKIRIITPSTPDRGLPPPNSRRNESFDDLESRLRDEFLPDDILPGDSVPGDAGSSESTLEQRPIKKYQSGDELVPRAAPPADRSTRRGVPMDRVRIANHLARGESTGSHRRANANRAQLRLISTQANNNQPAANVKRPTTEQPATQQPPAADRTTNDDAPKNVKGADIIVKVTPGGLVIASDDLDALDAFEDLVNQLADTTTAGGREFTVFYLKYVKSELAAKLLNSVFEGGTGDSGGGGSLFGDIAGAALGGGGGLLGGLLGGDTGGDLFGSSTSLQIVADPRLNALIVQGSPTDIDTVEQLLQVIDQEGSIEDVQVEDRPRFIPVFNNPASEIAETVKLVYADRVGGSTGGQQQQQRQPSPEEFIRMLRGGGGRGGRGGGGGGEEVDRKEVEKVSVNVDARSNSLIVVAPEYLFVEIEALVRTLDRVSEASLQTSAVVSPKRTNALVIQQYLANTYGDKIVTSSTTTGASTTPNTSTTPGAPAATPNAQPQGFQPPQGFQIPGQGIPFGAFGGRGGGDAGGDRGGRGGGDRGGRGNRGRGGR